MPAQLKSGGGQGVCSHGGAPSGRSLPSSVRGGAEVKCGVHDRDPPRSRAAGQDPGVRGALLLQLGPAAHPGAHDVDVALVSLVDLPDIGILFADAFVLACSAPS